MKTYSILIFQNEIYYHTEMQLEKYIKQGTKVYFFTYDPIDMLIGNEFLRKAMKEQILFLYEMKYNDVFQEDFYFYDGDVPPETLRLLSKYTPDFNREQYAIEHAPINGNIMVSAGAGTGKTTVMISRILFLKYKYPNLRFSEIGLVTFTKKAANHIREKLYQKVKLYFEMTKDMKYLQWLMELKNISIGTIHSFAQNILSLNKEKMFESQIMHIQTFKYKRKKIIEEVLDQFNKNHPDIFSKFKYIEQYRIIQAVETIIDQVMNYSISMDQLLNMDFGESADDSSIIYGYVVKETCKALRDYKKLTNSMDVNDLIIAMNQITEQQEKYTIPYKYVFIDEFQDTDRVQTKFFAYLANQYSVHLFVVGDVKQSIYRFRGADYTAFKQLEEQTRMDKKYYLQHNYRSNSDLLNRLNRIFAVWPNYVPAFPFNKEDYLKSGIEKESTLEPSFIHKKFDTKAGFVSYLREIENTDTAMLLRTNEEVNEMSRLCEENNIFFTSEQDGDFYRSVAVREFYQLVRRFTNPNHWANRYAVHISSYGDRTLKTEEILNHFSPDRSSAILLEEVDRHLTTYEDRLKHHSPIETLQDIISAVDPATVYAQRYLQGKKNQDDATKIKQAEILRQEYEMNLERLLYLLKKELSHTIPTIAKIERFLRIQMQTDKTMSTLYHNDSEVKRLTIMTVHKAKGLEFDYVFLPNTKILFNNSMKTDVIIQGNAIGYKINLKKDRFYENDVYKKLRKKEQMENIGEETRLLYVALTRAKKKVIVDAPKQTNNHRVRNWGDLIAKGISEQK
ncbi:DNA helicase [Compostibacillus humi]|uniref:DNA 3'-5' helicase n=1 Tax=Compostibacillus humi TaxID=1245525 RepID=A0A8J2TJP9_9BACI|nr:UvrD-helicase domain-containing protein [Compostibacillus humi]GFZ75994.1 DNA helicase [Compostibacillus humi]